MDTKKGEYYTANPYVYAHIKDARKNLLKSPTCAEHILWDYLRNRKTGYKIRRQHVIDKYVVDFVCLTKKLVIEIDGGIHLQQKEKDELRTKDLNSIGYKVIRFTNDEVYDHAGLVALKIKEELDNTTSPSLSDLK
jgi:very-short-patch-repair endonuclease